MLEDNLSIFKEALKNTNDDFAKFKSHINQLTEYLQNVTDTSIMIEQELKQHINFEYVSSLATLTLIGHERVTRNLKDVLKQTLKGEFTEFIPHDELVKEILLIAQTLDATSYTIISHLKDLQQIVSIRGTIKDQKLIIEIGVPILNRNILKLNKIITLPMKMNDKIISIKLEKHDFLVDNTSRTFIPVNQDELQKCKPILSGSLLCFPQTETYFESEELCESNILFESDTQLSMRNCEQFSVSKVNYVKQLNENTYFIMPKDSIPIVENCIKQESGYSRINDTGILKLSSNCEIILNGMKISTRNIKTQEITDVVSRHKYRSITIDNMTMLGTKMDKVKRHDIKFLETDDSFERLINETEKNINLIKSIQVTDEIPFDSMRVTMLGAMTILFCMMLIWCMIKACK